MSLARRVADRGTARRRAAPETYPEDA
jgi:hypothetical protein